MENGKRPATASTTTTGDKYTGNWNMGKQEGHGVYVYANGDRYVGEWAGGKHHGAGTYYFKSGKIFQGTYRNGSPSGHGVFVYNNGEKLDGEWAGSAYPDYGIYTYANGDRYGSWKQGKKHGMHLLLRQRRQVPGRVQGRRAARRGDLYREGRQGLRGAVAGGQARQADARGDDEVHGKGEAAASAAAAVDISAAAAPSDQDLILGLSAATLVGGPDIDLQQRLRARRRARPPRAGGAHGRWCDGDGRRRRRPAVPRLQLRVPARAARPFDVSSE